MFNRIWKKFSITLLIVALLPIGYFGYHELQSAKASIVEGALKSIFLNTITRAKDIERTFLNVHTDIRFLSSSATMRLYLKELRNKTNNAGRAPKLLEDEFSFFLALKPAYSRIGFLNEFGDEIAVIYRAGSEIKKLDNLQKRNRFTAPFYVSADKLERYRVAAVPMTVSVDPRRNIWGQTLIRYTTKVFGKHGEPKGVIYIDLNGVEIFNSLSVAPKRQAASFITWSGNFIYNPNFDFKQTLPPKRPVMNISEELSESAVKQVLSGKPGTWSDDTDYLVAFTPVFPQVGNYKLFYVVLDRYSKKKMAPILQHIKKRYYTTGFAVIFLCIIVAGAVSFMLTRNIGKLREGVEKFRHRQLGFRLNIRSGDEIESLAKAYNLMAEALQDYSVSLEKKVEERSQQIKQVERKLMQSEKLAAIGLLAAGVAHEINNPISIIITRLELIQKSLARGNTSALKKDLDVLHNHATRIGKITGNLLAFSRESANMVEAVDLNSAVARVMSLVEPSMKRKGVKLDRFLADGLPFVSAGRSGMEQVIYNIVYNAYQATDAGGKITIKTALNGKGDVELVVADTGSGIPKEDIKNIFDPFFTTKEVGEGTGLGLSITYGIVEDFGGSIKVESSPESGTVFTITLNPFKASVEAETAGKAAGNE